MKEDTKLFIFICCLGLLGGLVGGCIIGGILTILITMITDSALGLKTIWPVEFSISFHETETR
jgi:hypothetical protein